MRPADKETEPSPASILTRNPVALLTASQQAAYISLLGRGASPAAACLSLGISLNAVVLTRDQCPMFGDELALIGALLSQNVAAALYRQAIEGSVSAQTFYLKNCSPPEWQRSSDAQPTPDDLEELDDDELVELVRKTEGDLPAESASGTRAAEGPARPGGVSPTARAGG